MRAVIVHTQKNAEGSSNELGTNRNRAEGMKFILIALVLAFWTTSSVASLLLMASGLEKIIRYRNFTTMVFGILAFAVSIAITLAGASAIRGINL